MKHLSDQLVVRARHMRRKRYTWTQIGEHLCVSPIDLIVRLDPQEAKRLGIKRRGRQKGTLNKNKEPWQKEFHDSKFELVDIFYEAFCDLFSDFGAVFEKKPTLKSELRLALKKGQTITGFLMGDPLPDRSALAQRNMK